MVLSGMHLWLFSHQWRSSGSCCDNKCYHRLRGLSLPSLIFSLSSSSTRQELHLKFFSMCSQYWKSYNFCPLKEEDSFTVKFWWKKYSGPEMAHLLLLFNWNKHRASKKFRIYVVNYHYVTERTIQIIYWKTIMTGITEFRCVYINGHQFLCFSHFNIKGLTFC